MVAEYLEFRGFTVRQASNGFEALQIARAEAPKIILMDLAMPEVDGWEATRQLKADPKTKKTLVIAVTAHALSPDAQKARDAGCDAFIGKPFELSTLADSLQLLMEQGRRGLPALAKAFTLKPKSRYARS